MIEAAGGAVWRTSSSGRLKVMLIHRPQYDDWSLPKGKLRAGETHLEAALREIREETGFVCEPGVALPDVRYVHRKGRPKRVKYWVMRAVGGAFTPNREVDAIRWVRPEDARRHLTYDHDVPVVDAVASLLPLPIP